MTFLTLGQVPTTATLPATNINLPSAKLNGSVNANYLSTVVTFEYGISTSYGSTATAQQSPLSGNSITNVSADITGLTAGTTYHFRVNAVNSLGTTNGSDFTFSTVTDIDANVYNTVVIGTQTWMAENLKTTKYNDGTPIPNVTDNNAWAGLTTGAYCDYDNNPSNSNTYGKFYNWYAVDNNVGTKVVSNGGKNVCPTGWHIPTDAEWTTLTTFLGSESVAGGKLKETGTSHWTTPNTGATNETGFTAMPGGYRYYYGTYNYVGLYGLWWSSTEYSVTSAWYGFMNYSDAGVGRYGGNRQSGFSVRCLRD